MFVLKMLLISCLVAYNFTHGSQEIPRRRRLRLRQRITEAMRNRQRYNSRICYDEVGCFEIVNPRSPLQKLPEDPTKLDTKFYLFRRNLKYSEPEILYYNDNGGSIRESKFNISQPIKIIVHGFMGTWSNTNVLNATYLYLKIYDYNVISMDWSTAAKGPQYVQAAANTEVVGRQLGLFLKLLLKLGTNPNDIHLIGFSLGAHVAACASELLKNNGILIGRITGLDAAGPLFRNRNVKEKSKKLDSTDAKFVDVLHTDSSPVFVDGFGLWEPIGHVDFFANGGQQQPGCVDRQPSIVLTHLDHTLTEDSACSHVRAFELFLESLMFKAQEKDKCEFLAFKCPGGMPSFEKGQCFPKLGNINDPLAIDIKYRNDIGIMGEDVRGSGVMFFATRATQPFCGSQLQAKIRISQRTPETVGILIMEMRFDNEVGKFQISCDLSDLVRRSTDVSALSAVRYKSLNPELKKMQMFMNFYHYESKRGNNVTQIIPDHIIIEGVSVKDIYGNSWTYYGPEIDMNKEEGNRYGVNVVLRKTKS